MFRLYKFEKSVFTFDDYAVLLQEVRRSNAKTVLEFGPGYSTLAWVEAGCDEIVSLEHQLQWLEMARRKLTPFTNVKLIPYRNTPNVEVPQINGQQFDLAFVDSPVGVDVHRGQHLKGQENCSRLNTLLYALSKAPVVLLHDAKRPGEQRALQRLPRGYAVEMIDTRKGMARITKC